MLSLLAAPGLVIPPGSESPFLAARLRRCRAWNPITGAAVPALRHQTPPMQNATAGVYQRRARQSSRRCREVHWWVTRLTRSRGDGAGDTGVGQSAGTWDKVRLRGRRTGDAARRWGRLRLSAERREMQQRGNKYFNFLQTLPSPADLFSSRHSEASLIIRWIRSWCLNKHLIPVCSSLGVTVIIICLFKKINHHTIILSKPFFLTDRWAE